MRKMYEINCEKGVFLVPKNGVFECNNEKKTYLDCIGCEKFKRMALVKKPYNVQIDLMLPTSCDSAMEAWATHAYYDTVELGADLIHVLDELFDQIAEKKIEAEAVLLRLAPDS